MFTINYFSRSRLLAAACLLCSFSFHSIAQKSSPFPDSLILQTVVIQATRTGASSPVPHTNMSAGQIAKTYQGQDIPYLLTHTPSLVESSDAGIAIGYTGMRIRGSDPTRINVTINGVPLNDAESQGVFWVDLPDLAASAAEIQVQRGVGISTNGAGAFGATVNLDLSRINPEPYGALYNTAGSFGTRKHSASFGTGLLGGRFAFSGRLSRIVSEGYVDRASADMRSLHFSGAYIDDKQSLLVHFLSGHEITGQAWNGLPAQYVDVDSLRTFNTAGIERPGSPYKNEVDNYTQRHHFIHYKRVFPRGFSLQVNGHYTRGFGYYEQYKANQAYVDYGLSGDSLHPATDIIRQRWLDNHFYGGTFLLEWKPMLNPPALQGFPVFALGGAMSRYEGRHFGEVIWAGYGGVPDGFRYYDNDAGKLDGNLFGKIDIRFRGGFSVLIDMQYRQVHYTFLGYDNNRNNIDQTAGLHFFNPKAGIRWAFGSNWAAHTFFGVGHREPNRDDYTQSTPSSRPRPEQMSDWEAGVKGEYAIWSCSANLYFMKYRDQLVLDGRINDVGAYIRTNADRSYRAGIELETAVRPFPRLAFTGTATFSQNKITHFVEYRDNWDTGLQDAIQYHNTDLAFSPAVTARGEAIWDILAPAGKQTLSVAIAGKHVGRQFLDNTQNRNTALPAYFLTDLRLNFGLRNLLGAQIAFIVAVNNVLDRKYASNGWAYRYTSEGFDERPFNPYTRLEGNSVYHQAGYFPQAGRNWLATLAVNF